MHDLGELANLASQELDRIDAYAEMLDALEWPVWVKQFSEDVSKPPTMLWFNRFAQRLWTIPNYRGLTDFEAWNVKHHEIIGEWWDQERELLASGETSRFFRTSSPMPDGSVVPVNVLRSVINHGSRVMGFAWNPDQTRELLRKDGVGEWPRR